MADPIEIDGKSLAMHMATLRASTGWQILLRYMNEEREKIIAEGKKGRREEKTIKQWAVLSGFDACASLPEKLEQYGKVVNENYDPSEE